MWAHPLGLRADLQGRIAPVFDDASRTGYGQGVAQGVEVNQDQRALVHVPQGPGPQVKPAPAVQKLLENLECEGI